VQVMRRRATRTQSCRSWSQPTEQAGPQPGGVLRAGTQRWLPGQRRLRYMVHSVPGGA
jgi:hypothetical protein